MLYFFYERIIIKNNINCKKIFDTTRFYTLNFIAQILNSTESKILKLTLNPRVNTKSLCLIYLGILLGPFKCFYFQFDM